MVATPINNRTCWRVELILATCVCRQSSQADLADQGDWNRNFHFVQLSWFSSRSKSQVKEEEDDE